ncbi:thiamine pyrophosphate-binding protein [Pectobacterium cacticida]|uniref:Thiamine pyrophosphate-binding protein n=1 Tax=Pectobacterium cacticida TaxID=69221 RepID=A0ABZ2GC01_9GAMM|nr:thiamine pyrophosphate-dependent enzyme [Pectobacterium cacticida]UYX06475.1 thiamine pyrophosphate-binding protein [Pectobacterium cacticida]
MKTDYEAVQQLTGGDAVVKSLRVHGVDTVFALPGAQIYGLTDALARHSEAIRTLGARHEQTTAYMAFGYARSTGRPGVFTVVPGPGILNASAAMLTAHGCNTPVLALTGDVMSGFKDRGRGQLHEMPRQLDVLQHIGKWAAHIEQPTDAPWQIAQAFQKMQSGRPGVVSLQASWDYFTRVSAVRLQPPLALQPTPPIDCDAVEQAAKLLASARAPMIFVGSGALEASAEVSQLAEVLCAPVVSFRGGRGVVSDEHPLGFTVAAGAKLWPHTDVAVVIGSRFELLDIRWRYVPAGLKLIRIDIDPAEVRRIPAQINVIADAAEGANALVEAVLRVGSPKCRDAAIAEAKAAAEREIQSVQPQLDYLRVIRDVLPRDGFFIEEISQVGFTSIFGFPVYKPRTLVTSGHQGTLGFGFPTALGVKAAHPDKAVVSICGDGGFMFAAQELATAVQYKLNLVTIVFNNNAFGNVYRDQQESFDGRFLGSELVNPDFVKFAESFGVQASRVSTPAQLRPVMEQALAADRPVLIEVTMPRGIEASPWKFLHPTFPH